MLFSLQEHGKKNDVQVVEYGGEIWINQKRLKKKNLVMQILLTELNTILHNLKNEMRNTRVW